MIARIFLLFWVLSAAPKALAQYGLPTTPCRKNVLPGYHYVGTGKTGHKYQDASKRVTLYAQCYPMRVAYQDLIEKLKPQANPKNTEADAVYFEIPTETRKKRIYVITRKPALLLTFETRWRNGIWLEATENQILKAYGKPGKSKKPKFRKSK